jgi:ABC-type branched-subunit amino acid transport system ATPase component
MDVSLRAYVWARATIVSLVGRNEAGEGVISTAIAVLIMAAIGALMWVGFRTMWNNTSSQTNTQITKIGQ